MKANINDIQNALHDEKCGGGEDLHYASTNDWVDTICSSCPHYADCVETCAKIKAFAKRG